MLYDIIEALTDIDPETAAAVAAQLIRDGHDRAEVLDLFPVDEDRVAAYL